MAIPSSIVERAKARSGSSGSSSSGGRSSGRVPSSVVERARARGGRSSVTGVPQRGYFEPGGAGEVLRRAADKNKGAGPGFTPIRIVLDAASAPFYATGNLLAGDPLESVKNLVGVGQWGRKQFVSEAPIVARAIESIPGPRWLRTGVGITTDFAFDPLTYVSFGAGSAIRGAAGQAARAAQKGAAEALQEAAENALRQGRKLPTARENAEALIRHAETGARAPQSLKVRARIPLSRNRGALIAESELLARAVKAVTGRVRETSGATAVRRIFRADQGVDPWLYEGRRGVRYWGEATERYLMTSIREAKKDVEKIARDAGEKGDDLAEFLTRHLDQPNKYAPETPVQEAAAARAVELRDEIEQISRDAGIDMGFVENYVMHLPADRRSAIAFEKRFGRRAEDQPYTQQRALQNLDQWEALGLNPELNVWKLMETRAQQGVRDAAIKGYFDTLAARGVKPPPLLEIDVGGQLMKVEEAQSLLDSMMRRVDTAPQQAAVQAARANLSAARKALEVAQTAPNQAAVARAERALAHAQAQAQPAAIMARPAVSAPGRSVQDVAAQGLEVAAQAGRSRSAIGAALPQPTAGRFRTRPPAAVAARRLMRRANQLRVAAEEGERALYKALAPMAKQIRESEKGLRRGFSQSVGGTRLKSTLAAYARDVDPSVGGKRNVADPVTRTAARGGGTRDKRLDELVDDVVEQMRRDPNLTPEERMIVDEFDRFSAMRQEADDVERAVRGRNAPEDSIEFGPEDRLAARARFEELAGELGAPVNARARRERAAQPAETPRMARNVPGSGELRGFSVGAKARFRDYFTSEGPLEGTIRSAREAALAEVEGAQRATRREVEKAQRRLAVAKASKDEEGIRYAQRQLKLAQRTERAVSEELAAARQTFGGTPREVAAATRALIAELRTLGRMENQARKVLQFNERLAARPGAQADSWEDYRNLVGEGWQEHTSKYHRGTLLDPSTAEAVRKVDAETLRLIKTDSAVEGITSFFSQIGTAWKALALLSPRYHIRNFVDDGLADWIAGARNPRSYEEAAEIKLGREGTIKTKLYGEVDHETVLAMAEMQGVLHQGFAAWELAKQQERGVRRFVSAPGSGRTARAGRKVGEVREDWSRLGLYIEMLKKGEDWIQAGRTVRRYRYDYADLAPALMAARAVAIPFLTFTWKTIPLLAHIAATRPGVFSKTNILVEWLNELGGSPDRSLLPPWARDSFGVPMPDALRPAFDGEPGEPMVFNPRLTFRYGNIDQLDPRASHLARNVGGMVGPIALPFTAITGYSMFRGRQLDPNERTRAPALIEGLHQIGLPIKGYGPKRDAFTGEEVPGYSGRLHEILSVFPPFQQTGSFLPGGGISDWRRALTRYLTGADVSPERRDRALFYAERYGRVE